MTLTETVESFTPDKQAALTATLIEETGCHMPSCFLELRITSGSLGVAAVLTIPDDSPDGAGAGAALAAQVESAAETLAAQPPSALSESLGVTVESAAPVEVQAGVTVPVVVAPPPPAPPSPPLPPPPPPPPQKPLLSNADDLRLSEKGDGEGDDSMILIVAAAGGGAGAVLLLVLLVYCAFKQGARSAQRAHTVTISKSREPKQAAPANLELQIGAVSASSGGQGTGGDDKAGADLNLYPNPDMENTYL